MKTLWGIDLGGTKIEGVILRWSSEKVEIVSRVRIATQREKGYDHIIDRVAAIVKQLSDHSGMEPQAIGFGTPGALDPFTQRMKNCNTTSLNNQPLQADLEDLLKIPIRMDNDANCFVKAETQMGIVKQAAPEAKVIFGVIMGTGVGGGLVIEGRLINGRHGITGEWGHIFLDESGGNCYCGRTGCVETVISGPALEHFYATRSGSFLGLPHIIERARKGKDEIAMQTLERLIHFFGKGIAQVINIIDPDVIVLGGGLGNIDELYSAKARKAIEAFLFNPYLNTVFLKPSLGDSAGVFGAALLMKE